MRFFFFFLILSNVSFSQVEDLEKFSWHEDRELKWSDFKGKPNNTSKAAALSSTGIGFGISMQKKGTEVTSFNATVDCYFYPTESWFKENTVTPRVLSHEQFHFNITELLARKFRFQISKMKPSSDIKNRLSSLYKQISKASFDMQNKYDEETNHSINKEQQIAWETHITSELKKLEAFKTE